MDNQNVNYSHAIDILADLIIQFSGKLDIPKVRAVSQEVKDYILNMMEKEFTMEVDHELTTQLLRTPHYKRVA